MTRRALNTTSSNPKLWKNYSTHADRGMNDFSRILLALDLELT